MANPVGTVLTVTSLNLSFTVFYMDLDLIVSVYYQDLEKRKNEDFLIFEDSYSLISLKEWKHGTTE
jgi:hypothetical protein